MKKNETGSALIIVIFLLVILLILAIGVTSVGTGGLENSVAIEKEIETSQKGDAIADILAGSTKTSGEAITDVWFDNIGLPSSSGITASTYGAMAFAFVDSNPKEFRFTVDKVITSTGASVSPKGLTGMYVNIIGNWTVEYIKEGNSIYNENTALTVNATNGGFFVNNNERNNLPKYYSMRLKDGTGEYTAIVRLFYEKE